MWITPHFRRVAFSNMTEMQAFTFAIHLLARARQVIPASSPAMTMELTANPYPLTRSILRAVVSSREHMRFALFTWTPLLAGEQLKISEYDTPVLLFLFSAIR